MILRSFLKASPALPNATTLIHSDLKFKHDQSLIKGCNGLMLDDWKTFNNAAKVTGKRDIFLIFSFCWSNTRIRLGSML